MHFLKPSPNAEERFAVRGGMTGPVQLIGRDSLSDVSRLALEIEYCHASLSRYSMRLDFVIPGVNDSHWSCDWVRGARSVDEGASVDSEALADKVLRQGFIPQIRRQKIPGGVPPV